MDHRRRTQHLMLFNFHDFIAHLIFSLLAPKLSSITRPPLGIGIFTPVSAVNHLGNIVGALFTASTLLLHTPTFVIIYVYSWRLSTSTFPWSAYYHSYHIYITYTDLWSTITNMDLNYNSILQYSREPNVTGSASPSFK